MKKENENSGKYEKTVRAVGIALAIATIVLGILGILQSFEVVTLPVELLPIMMLSCCGTMVCQALNAWRSARTLAIFSFCVSGFMIVVFLCYLLRRWGADV